MTPVPGRERRKLGATAVLLAVLPVFALGNTYYLGLLTDVLVFALLAVALNIVFGHTDQLFLFTGGLAGIGAYTTALLSDWLGVTAWATLPVAVLGCGLVGLLVSWIAAKRKFTVINIAILTLALQLALMAAFVGARDITGGSTGFRYDYFSLDVVADAAGVSEGLVVYYTSLAGILIALAVYLVLVHSKLGLAFDAIREDEIAAEAAGIDAVRTKVIAGFVAAALVGLGGTLYALSASHITPELFSFLGVDVVVLVVLVVGGLRTTLGPLAGTVLIVASEELLAGAPQWRTALFGGLLVLLFLYFRNGIVVFLRERLERVRIANTHSEETASR